MQLTASHSALGRSETVNKEAWVIYTDDKIEIYETVENGNV